MAGTQTNAFYLLSVNSAKKTEALHMLWHVHKNLLCQQELTAWKDTMHCKNHRAVAVTFYEFIFPEANKLNEE